MPAALLAGLAQAIAITDEPGAETVVAALAALPAEQANATLAVLETWLADTSQPDPERRWWAVRAAAALSGAAAVSLLAGCLTFPDPALVQCAAVGLRQRPGQGLGGIEPAIPALARLLDDPDGLTRRLAGDALVAAGPAAVPALLEALENATPPARREAIRALAQVGDERAVPALFAALDADSALMQYWAEQGLERMGIGMAFFMP